VIVPVVLMGPMPIFIATLGCFRGAKRTRIYDRRIGDLSYPVYLNHYTVLILIASFGVSRSWASLWLALAGSIVVSWIAAIIIETPIRPLRNRIRGESL
jgi:peptidoglycan/LPS O-acetylase OafA/YrhL